MDLYEKEKRIFINFLEDKSYEYGWGRAIELAADYYAAYLDHKNENEKLYEENIELKETITNILIYHYLKDIE